MYLQFCFSFVLFGKKRRIFVSLRLVYAYNNSSFQANKTEKKKKKKNTYCHTRVSPGMGATLHTFLARTVLMTLLLPTLGYPRKPTVMCLRSLCRREN